MSEKSWKEEVIDYLVDFGYFDTCFNKRNRAKMFIEEFTARWAYNINLPSDEIGRDYVGGFPYKDAREFVSKLQFFQDIETARRVYPEVFREENVDRYPSLECLCDWRYGIVEPDLPSLHGRVVMLFEKSWKEICEAINSNKIVEFDWAYSQHV